jgi:hypothetical protein
VEHSTSLYVLASTGVKVSFLNRIARGELSGDGGLAVLPDIGHYSG